LCEPSLLDHLESLPASLFLLVWVRLDAQSKHALLCTSKQVSCSACQGQMVVR
jgi:hypothetical protein